MNGYDAFVDAEPFADDAFVDDDLLRDNPGVVNRVGWKTGAVETGRVVMMCPKGCKSQYCPSCGPAQGWREKRRLGEAVKEKSGDFGCMGITLTLDPKLFPSPKDAYLYVRDKECLSKLVRMLHKAGLLRSREYRVVLEFQKDTKMPHWHMIVFPKSHVRYWEMFAVVVEIWGKFRPKDAPPLPEPITRRNWKGKAPAFGSVSITENRPSKGGPKGNADWRLSWQSAVQYITAYLVKYPREGYPQWVFDLIDEGKQIHRFSGSQGFYPSQKSPCPPWHAKECFCEYSRGDVPPYKPPPKPSEFDSKWCYPEDAEGEPEPRNRVPIQRRIAFCRNAMSLGLYVEYTLPDGSKRYESLGEYRTENSSMDDMLYICGLIMRPPSAPLFKRTIVWPLSWWNYYREWQDSEDGAAFMEANPPPWTECDDWINPTNSPYG